jgi:hypothetical protein
MTQSSVGIGNRSNAEGASQSLLELFDRPQKSNTVDDFEQAHGRF